MSRVFVNDTTLTDIADAIREKNGSSDTYKPSEMSNAILAIKSGGDDYYNEFWDIFQENGNRKDYTYAFVNWGKELFNPKYDIVPNNTGGAYAFYNLDIDDFDSFLKELNIKLNVSSCTNLQNMFANSNVTKIPPLYLDSCTSLNASFGWCLSLETVTLYNIKKTCNVQNIFISCSKLKNLTITGEIGKSITFQYCSLLTNESIQNIIDCLADLTGATAQTLTFHADVKAKLTEEQLATIINKNWTLA